MYVLSDVAMAARSLIHLYRKIDPSKLKRKFKVRYAFFIIHFKISNTFEGVLMHIYCTEV